MPLHVSSTCAHYPEVKTALHSLWYHHTYRWPSRAQVERRLSQPVHETATYRCDDTRGCVMQFWPPDDKHTCSKYVEAWNKLTVKHILCIKLVNYWDKSNRKFPQKPTRTPRSPLTATIKHNTCFILLYNFWSEHSSLRHILSELRPWCTTDEHKRSYKAAVKNAHLNKKT